MYTAVEKVKVVASQVGSAELMVGTLRHEATQLL